MTSCGGTFIWTIDYPLPNTKSPFIDSQNLPFCLLTAQEESGSHGDDGAFGSGERREFVEIIHSILEKERNLDIQHLKKIAM